MSGGNIFARPARIAAIAPYLWMLLLFLKPSLLGSLTDAHVGALAVWA